MLHKKFVFLFVAIATVFFGCNQDKIKQLEEENATLKGTASRQDSLLNDFLMSFNQIEENLAVIRQREDMISVSSDDPEMLSTGRGKIVEDIQTINELLAQNRATIDELNEKLEQSGGRASQLQKAINNLTNQVNVKDGEINQLKEELVAKNFEIEELGGRIAVLNLERDSLITKSDEQTARLTQKTDTIQQQTVALNTAYYIVGTFKELKEKNIVTKEGIGLGRTPQLGNNLDPSSFTQIDIREVNTIPISSKKAAIVTSHPSNSYTLHEEGKVVDNLEIKDPENFWSSSKYLVVVLN